MDEKEDLAAETALLLPQLTSYLSSACSGVLGCPLPASLSPSENEILTKFVVSDASLLYVEKTSEDEELRLYGEVKFSPRTVSSMAFVKVRDSALSQRTPIPKQLQVITLGSEKDIYSFMQQYARHSFTPLVRIAGAHIPVSQRQCFALP